VRRPPTNQKSPGSRKQIWQYKKNGLPRDFVITVLQYPAGLGYIIQMHLIPTSWVAIFVLLSGVIPIGFVCTAVAAFLRFGQGSKPERSQDQTLVDWSIYTLGVAALLCMLCLLSVRYRRELPSLRLLPFVLGGLGLAFVPISAGCALWGRGVGRLTILIAQGLLALVFLGTYFAVGNVR